MNNTSNKVSYLKGLLEGMEFEPGSANAKLIPGIVELLGDLSDRLDVVDDLIDDLNDYVESIDDDLSALEDSDADGDDAFSFMEDEDDDEDFEDFDGGEDQLHLLRPDSDDGEETRAPVLCPSCGKPFVIHYEDPDGAVYACPHCGDSIHPIEFSLEKLPTAKPKD